MTRGADRATPLTTPTAAAIVLRRQSLVPTHLGMTLGDAPSEAPDFDLWLHLHRYEVSARNHVFSVLTFAVQLKCTAKILPPSFFHSTVRPA